MTRQASAFKRFGSWLFWPAIVGGVMAITWWLWFSDLPLGVEGEWTWARIEIPPDHVGTALLGGFSAGLAALLYLAFCLAGEWRIGRASRWEVVLWMTALPVVGFGWLWSLQEAPIAPYQLSKTVWVLYYPRSSGYFYEARYGEQSTKEFLKTYENRMAEGDVLHIGTHPPGLFLLHRALIEWCHASPELTKGLRSSEPESVSDAFTELQTNAASTSSPVLSADRAAVWLAALLTQLAAVCTVWPCYAILRHNFDRSVSWRAICFWPLLPAVAVFLPKSDALYPVLGMTFLWLWLRSIDATSHWRSAVWGALGGFCFSFSLWLSLAFLPVGLLAGLFSIERGIRSVKSGTRNRTATIWLASAGAFGAVILLSWLLLDLNLPLVWWRNYRNHAGFYAEYDRTWWKWTVYNPIELVLSVGVPVFVTAACGAVSSWRHPSRIWVLSAVAVWALLWLSGKNMGEAARLWIILYPWLIVMMGNWLETDGTIKGNSTKGRLIWVSLLGIQSLVCIITVTRWNGFP